MKVSVFLPAYNHEAFVGEAIESVLNQSFTDFEFLIGDDASPDGTVNVIRSYTDERIRFFPHSRNYGATFNHRHLIEQAKGEYVALINSDDVWLPGKLEKQVAYMDAHPEVVMCSCWAQFVDEDGKNVDFGVNVFEQPNRTQAQWIEYFFCQGNCICHPGVLVRRSVYEKLGTYHLALRQLPDFHMWIRMIREGNFYIFQEPMVQHRRFMKSGKNTSSVTVDNAVRDAMEAYYIATEYLEDLPDDLFQQAFRKYFRKKDASTHMELVCERFFLLESGRFYMDKVYLQAAIMYFLHHYDAEMAKTLRDTYRYELSDFHRLSCKVDLMGLKMPAVTGDGVAMSQAQAEQALIPQGELLVYYIRKNPLKTLGLLLFNPQSKFYQFCKRIYRRCKK